MIACPSCKHANLEGAVFCEHCGTQLTGRDVTQTIQPDQMKDEFPPEDKKKAAQIAISPDTWCQLHLVDTGQVLPLSTRREFTLGRISEDQPIMPDIDLTPFQAYSSGVSRMHALIKSDGPHIVIMDLGSANGTYVNGRRLPANTDNPLKHGDVVALGKLKIQVLLTKNPS